MMRVIEMEKETREGEEEEEGERGEAIYTQR
jgi:hypothetical protein